MTSLQNKPLPLSAMPSEQNIARQRAVQNAAKSVLAALPQMIDASDNEQTIAEKAKSLLQQQGYTDTWYYDCHALVLLGSRSCMSVSGKTYQPQTELVGQTNLITVDLSPLNEECWGDFARSFPVENGRVISHPQSLEFQNGLRFVQAMQAHLLRIARPDYTFGQLFDWANLRIRQSGFVNLDYRNNVGHSIATSRENRQFIEANNQAPLSSVDFFSFEPFVRLKGGHWGFKHEGIFFFNPSGALEEV